MTAAEELDGTALVGGRVQEAMMSVYVDLPTGDRSPLCPTLLVDGSWIQLSTRGGVVLYRIDPPQPCDFPELAGRLEYETASEPWDVLVGRTITDMVPLRYLQLDPDSGWLIRAGDRAVGVVDLADDIHAWPWPHPRWSGLHAVVQD